MAEKFVGGGVKGIINITPICLNMSEEIKIFHMDLSSEPGRMVYQLEND